MRKSVRIAITFSLLLGGYLGYARLFAVVADRLQVAQPAATGDLSLSPSDSASAREAKDLARRVFGDQHWTAFSDKRYYNVERGYWMYFNTYERINEGRRIEFAPFVIIWKSKDDPSLKVISGDKAIVDFDQPFNLINKPGASPSIEHARIEGIGGPVEIRDDRGTALGADDLIVTMPYVEYFESASQIRCEQAVQLVDRDVQVDGTGLTIALRSGAGGPGGFDGAESIILDRDVVIRAEDVGRTGLLPGPALPQQQVPGAAAKAPSKTPARLMSDGPMHLYLPKPRWPVWVGPPAPERPTIAEFSRNVIIQRGAGDKPDQINGDHLRAILVPSDDIPKDKSLAAADIETVPEPPSAAAESETEAAPVGGGPMTDLSLQEARVDGHAVWLQSEAEGATIRANELIYKKPGGGLPDVTYLRADPGKQLWLERLERDEKGNRKSVLTVWATDATVHGSPEPGGGTTVVARGPGLLEMRADRDRPVDRSATWQDEMILQTGVPEPAPADGSASASADATPKTLTYVTLTGWPVIDDPEQVLMASRDQIVACLEDRPRPPGTPDADADAAGSTQGESYRIRWMKARGDVHMDTPDSTGLASAIAANGRPAEGRRQSLNARDQLSVVFAYPAVEVAPTPAPAGGSLATARTVAVAEAGPQPRAQLAAEGGPAAAPSAIVAATDPNGRSQAQAPPAPPEPGMDVEADVIWARVEELTAVAGARPKREVREVRLRGDAVFHQDPEPGEERGLDVAAAALDVLSPGPNRAWFQAHGAEDRWATVSTPEFDIEGPVLGLDQARDHAWVKGPGRLTQVGATDMLTDLGGEEDGNDAVASSSETPRDPMIIDWAEGMLFHGSYADENGHPGPARALFLSKVLARSGEDRIACDEMEAIMDRPVSFARGAPGGAGTDGDRQKPKVASVICTAAPEDETSWVDIRSVERDGKTREVREVRRVVGRAVTFAKESGKYWVDDTGAAVITTREAADEGAEPNPRQRGGVAPKPRPLYQTRIDFRRGMDGRLGQAPVGAKRGSREAEFRGDVQVLRAQVGRFETILQQDFPPADAIIMEAAILNVESNPAVPASGIPARDFMKSRGNAQAQSDGKTIQGDYITYDTQKGLFYARGVKAPVIIASQEAPGQPVSTSAGVSVSFNPKSSDLKVLGPSSIQFFQPKTADRIGPSSPEEAEEEEKERRPEPRLPPRGDIEAKGFSGR